MNQKTKQESLNMLTY